MKNAIEVRRNRELACCELRGRQKISGASGLSREENPEQTDKEKGFAPARWTRPTQQGYQLDRASKSVVTEYLGPGLGESDTLGQEFRVLGFWFRGAIGSWYVATFGEHRKFRAH